jgi:hypothetical protein
MLASCAVHSSVAYTANRQVVSLNTTLSAHSTLQINEYQRLNHSQFKLHPVQHQSLIHQPLNLRLLHLRHQSVVRALILIRLSIIVANNHHVVSSGPQTREALEPVYTPILLASGL